jgi:hypothetical protein
MRGVVLAWLAGCSFAPAGSSGDAMVHDVQGDTPVAGKCGGTVWFADFSSDPTAYDDNGDGVNDFTLRGSLPFPTAELVGGEWVTPSATQAPLDTMPGQLFTRHMFVDARMRSTTTSGQRGAVFYINVGYDGSAYAVLIADVKLTSASNQKIELVNRIDPSNSTLDHVFASAPTNPTTPLDVSLEIDPQTLEVTYAAGTATGTYTLLRAPPQGAPPPWASLTAYSGAAAFDQIRIEICP